MIQVTLARCRNERASVAARERLQQQRKMEALSQLAGGIADEVDDLLTALYGQLEVLGRHVIGEPVLADPIQDTFSEAIEKERLIRRLLEFCGRRKLTPATISVTDQMARVSGRLRRIVGDAIPIRVLLPDDLWQARIDPDQLAHALANLAANARAAMPDGGSLTIEAQNAVIDQDPLDSIADAGRYVLLSVTDTGTGMPDDVVERAFEPFFTTRPSGGGSGLGLSLVFGFVRQSGGHISIDSKPGSGTTVRIYLPAATGDILADTAADGDERRSVALLDPQGGRATATGETIVLDRVAAAESQAGCNHVRPLRSTTSGQDVASPVLWHRAENAVFASVPGPMGQIQYRLIVEPLPRQNGWDWTVWQPGNEGQQTRYGRASSIVSAMAAAENAAGHWVITGE
jgi:nitrogen-specific signal transduction histidine kinase